MNSYSGDLVAASSPLRGKIEMGVKGFKQERSGNRNRYNTLGG